MNASLFLRVVEEAYADELEPGQLDEAWRRGIEGGLERAERFDLVIDAQGRFVVVPKKGVIHE